MAGIKFTETDVPKIQRGGVEAGPNPYQEVADHLADHLRTDDSPGKAVTFKPLTHHKDDAEKNLRTAVNRLRAAPGDRFTMRTKVNDDGFITAWGIPKVTRKRKGEKDATEAS